MDVQYVMIILWICTYVILTIDYVYYIFMYILNAYTLAESTCLQNVLCRINIHIY